MRKKLYVVIIGATIVIVNMVPDCFAVCTFENK